MKKEKKSRFWTFWFSFLPGAAEMYMGFMKMGVSLLSLFFASIFVAYIIDIGPLLCVTCIIWFYGFFHARNMARLSSAELNELEDTYIVNCELFTSDKVKKVFVNQKIIAWTFIIIGGFLVWKAGFSSMSRLLPDGWYWIVRDMEQILLRLILGCGTIWAGIMMIRGKKVEFFKQEEVSVKKEEIEESKVELIKEAKTEEREEEGKAELITEAKVEEGEEKDNGTIEEYA